MTEFKQIIGRGTRLRPDYGKEYFTIMDFRGVCRLFADPDFDGEPIVDDNFNSDEYSNSNMGNEKNVNTTENGENSDFDANDENDDNSKEDKPKKYRIRGIDIKILNERVQYYDKDGKLITESITDYSKKNILGEYATLDEFINIWNSEQKKQVIIDELQEKGVLLEALREAYGNNDIDDFDLICHIAYDKKPLTKAERANNVKKRGYLYQYSELAQQVLNALLDKYMDKGITDITSIEILLNDPFRQFGTPMKITKLFGGKVGYLNAVKELEKQIYAA